MTTLYWNPQVTDFRPTEDDDVVFTWGTGTFPDITARSITIGGGSNITVGSFTTTSLTINNGAYFKSTDTQDISCNTVNIQGGASVDIYGHLTSDTYVIGNGAQVHMHGGLTINSFDFGGGFDLTVDGQFSVGGKIIVDEGDVSWIWDVDIHYGSHIHHNHDPDPCYLEGTKILTLEGWKTVENLKVGDQVTVYKADGEVTTSPITWVGKGQANVLNVHHVDDRSGYPVRVCKNAIAEGVPYTDLLVTPEHMLCIKDVFIPVRCLVNHFSIYYDSTIPVYTYYHFTTETHSVVNANGILSETYLGGQHQWDDTNIHMVVKDTPSAARPIVTNTAFLAQLQADILRRCDKGKHTEDALLSDRVFSLTLKDTDGHTVHALRSKDNTHVFMIPRTRDGLFHLDVPVHRPVDLFGPSVDDRRYLGARMEFSIVESNGQITPLHVDYPSDTSWYPDGWSKSGSRITLPKDTRMLSVKVIEHVWDMAH